MPSDTNNLLISKLNKINLSLMLVFYTLYRERHLTQTANKLCLSQPAVSHSLKKLRHIFNDELFIKTADGMLPTPASHQIDSAIEKGLFYFEQALTMNRDFDQGSSTREFKIGLTDFMNQQIQPYLIRHALKHTPHICFNFLPAKIARIEESESVIRAMDLDIAIAQLKHLPQDSCFELLYEDPIGCIADLNLFGTRDEISMEVFLATPHVVLSHREDLPSIITQKLKHLGVTRTAIAKTSHVTPVTKVLPNARLLSPCSESMAAIICPGTSLKFYRLPFEVSPFKVGLLWDIRKDKDSGIRWLRRLIGDAMEPKPGTS